jgi:hypothetical protein
MKANGFRPIPDWLSRCPESFEGTAALNITTRHNDNRHKEPS